MSPHAIRRAILSLILVPLLFAPRSIRAQQPAATVPPGVTYCPGLIYDSPGGRALKLDLAYPKAGPGPFPVVMIVHGTGPLNHGRRVGVPLALDLAADGYVGVTVGYRHRPQDAFPGAVEDVRHAVRWLRGNAARYKIDPERMGVLGYSGGGSLALLVGLADPGSRVRAVVAYSPPTDFARLHRDCCTGQIPFTPASWIKASLEAWLGGPPEKCVERYREASPVCHCRPGGPPVLLLHGTEDQVVPWEQSRAMARALRKAGGQVTLLEFDGAPHDFDDLHDLNARLARLVARTFLERELKAARSEKAKGAK